MVPAATGKTTNILLFDVISKGKVRCFFNVSDEEWQKQRVDFNNSELSRYKILVEQIKDLAY